MWLQHGVNCVQISFTLADVFIYLPEIGSRLLILLVIWAHIAEVVGVPMVRYYKTGSVKGKSGVVHLNTWVSGMLILILFASFLMPLNLLFTLYLKRHLLFKGPHWPIIDFQNLWVVPKWRGLGTDLTINSLLFGHEWSVHLVLLICLLNFIR